MSIKRRKSAQDVFQNSNISFSKKGTFSEVFPTVENVHVEVEESGHGIKDYSRERAYDRDSFVEYVNCQNSGCYGGGFSVGEVLREATEQHLTTNEKSGPCIGYYSGPSGRRKGLPCDHKFRVKVLVTYKD